MLLCISKNFTETLKMNNFPFAEKADRVCYFRVFYHAQNIVIGGAGFLFCCKVLKQISNRITLYLELAGIKRNTSCCLGPYANSMINIIRTKSRSFNFFWSQVSG